MRALSTICEHNSSCIWCQFCVYLKLVSQRSIFLPVFFSLSSYASKANFVTELQNSQPSSDKAKHRPPILGESSILFPFYGPDSPPGPVCPSNHSFLKIRPQILLQGTTMSIVNFHKATMLMDVSDEW